jgi:hypothetical protein
VIPGAKELLAILRVRGSARAHFEYVGRPALIPQRAPVALIEELRRKLELASATAPSGRRAS